VRDPTTAAETAALQFITAIALHESPDVTASTAYPGVVIRER
jgi:hypothetical protein